MWCWLRIKPQRLTADSACGLEARQNAVSELHTLDQFWQLVVAVDPAPIFLRAFDKLEHHGKRGLVR